MKTPMFLLALVLVGTSAGAGQDRVRLPPTYTIPEGGRLAAATTALCVNSGVSGWQSWGRWERWLMVKGNGALADPSRLREGPGGVNVLVYAGETYRVPENLCAPFISNTEIVIEILAVLAMILAYAGTEVVNKRALRELRARADAKPAGAT